MEEETFYLNHEDDVKILIGRGGGMIHSLCARTGCSIRVHSAPSPTIRFEGTRDQIDFAMELVSLHDELLLKSALPFSCRFLTNCVMCDSNEQVGKVLGGTSHDELPKGHATIKVGYLNHWLIGRVMGTTGVILEQLQKETRTHITVHPGKNTFSKTRKFCVVGTVRELHASL